MKKLFVFVVTIFVGISLFGVNNCLDFDGTDDYIEIPNNGTGVLGVNSVNESFTIETWFKFTVGGTLRTMFAKHSSDEVSRYHGFTLDPLDLGSGNKSVSFSYAKDVNFQWEVINGSTIINDGSWHHLACVYDNSGYIKLYIDGILQSESSQFTPSHAQSSINFRIMSHQYWYNPSWSHNIGKIDEFRIWNTVRTETEIRQNMYKELVGTESNLVAYYNFNETSGTTADNGEGTSTYDGTLTNMTGNEWQTSSALFGAKNCLDFDGSDDYINCGYVANPSSLSNLTLECWINPQYVASGHYNRIISQDYLNSGPGWLNLNWDGAAYSYLTGLYTGSSLKVSQNEWTHLALVWDGSNIYFYFNGAQDSNVYPVSTLPDSDNDLYIGWQGHYNNTYFNGEMDEIRIWNDARTVSEIRENMCKTLTGNESNLVAYYNFDNTSGTILQDYSGNGNDGTLYNTANDDWVVSTAFTTWLNTNTSTWSTGTNWSGGSTPSSTDNIGVYSYSGGTDAVLNGTPTLQNMVLGSDSDITLSSNFSVTGNLILESDLDLNGYTIDLGDTGLLIEDNGYLIGNDGELSASENYSSGITSENIRELGAEITTSSALGDVTVTRGFSAFSVNTHNSISRYYDIAPANNSGLDATLVFYYDEADLNGQNEATLSLWRSVDGGSTWLNMGGTVDTNANTITLENIESFSIWTAADNENPLPVVLSTFTAIQTQANYAQLNWTTQSETNNAFWNIYRADKDDFTLAKTVNPAPVEGQGNTTTETNYTFTDETVSSTNATYWYWLESVSLSGESNICGNISIEMSEPDNPTPPINIVTGLHQNYPNPFNPDTKIQFAVEEPTKAKLSIFNQKGQKVITLFDDIAHPDQYYKLDWNGQDSKGKSVASGLYFYKLETDSNDSIKKMLLIK